jgi:hypothetical protein
MGKSENIANESALLEFLQLSISSFTRKEGKKGCRFHLG